MLPIIEQLGCQTMNVIRRVYSRHAVACGLPLNEESKQFFIPLRLFHFHPAKWHVLTLVSLSAVFQAPAAMAQQSSSQSPTISTVFPRVPREVTRHFDQVRERVKEKSYSEAAIALSAAITHLDRNDYLVPQGNSAIATGYRSGLFSELANSDATVFDQFEQMHGGEARALLDEAVTSRNVVKLQACAQKWFLTRAGQEASIILARLDLDRNRPVAAIRRLTSAPDFAARHAFDSERSLLLAVALSRSGRLADGTKELESLKNQKQDLKLLAGDVEITLNDQSNSATEFLPERTPDLESHLRQDDWLVYRGNPTRTPAVPSVDTSTMATWKRSLVANEQKLSTWRASIAEWDMSLPSVASPLIVDDQVVARNLQSLQGVRIADGETIWSYPPVLPPHNIPATTEVDATRASQITRDQAEKLWVDASFGRFSSDGIRVFFIDHKELAPTRIDAIQLAFFGQESPPKTIFPNALVALDVTREGALAWMVGDLTGVTEPDLAEAFFLSPPLTVDGMLYAVAEIKGEVRLLVLTSSTGRLQWSLTLAHLDTETIANRPARRFPGISPLYAGGILICPTFTGSLVAIDVSLRQFLWGFQYREVTKSQADRRGMPLGLPFATAESLGRHWYDADVMLAGTSLLAAAEGDQLYCLDVETGKTRWKRDRRDTMYFAIVGDDQLLLLGEHRFTSVRISDGTYVWHDAPFVAIPGGGSPRGRGLFDGSHYYLPTTDPELLKVSTADGRIVERRSLKESLGNLVTNGKTLISQNETSLSAFDFSAGGVKNAIRQNAVAGKPKSLSPADSIAKFTSHDFVEREAASRELLEANPGVVPALMEGASSANAEVAHRCTSLLVHLLDATNTRVATEARSALLSASSANPSNRIVSNAYARESRKRGQQAIKDLEKLGATVKQEGRFVSLPPTWQGKNDGLSHLVWLTQLESLELRHSVVDDSGIGHLRGLPNLKTLNLHRSSISNEGLRFLVELPKLDTLLLQGTQIDDIAIKYLGNLTQLKAMNLVNTKFSTKGVAELQQLQPDVKILF